MQMQWLIVALMFVLQPSTRDKAVVFVCEHGAAKSVVATAYFNKLAAERGLRERAIYRGTSPQDELSVATLKGLRDDGLSVPATKPSPITAADVTAATHIFAIGCSLPAHAKSSGKAEDWTDVPEVSDRYTEGNGGEALRRQSL